MKFLALLFVFIAACQAVSFFDLVQEEWGSFKLTHKKQYESETEERFRMKIFMENAHKVAKHNKLYALGLVSYKLGINKYADMLHHEFVKTVNGFNRTKNLMKGQEMDESVTFIRPANVQLPKEVDWRQHGAVTAIKDQGQCGSCWSFSATGSLEGQHFRKTGKLVSLSEQNLIDCSTKYGNNGCDGGLMDNAFRYIKDNKGIDTETSYPYKAEDEKCHYNAKNKGADDKGFVDIESGNELDLKAAVATVGPVSVAIDASHETFQLYSEAASVLCQVKVRASQSINTCLQRMRNILMMSSNALIPRGSIREGISAVGIYSDPDCSSEELDHGVLVVGYGTDPKGQDYWIVKNSWGTSWGQSGYIKMARNQANSCGIATQASYPLV